MKKQIKNAAKAVKNVTVTMASGSLGAIHFLSQSVADLSMEAEASLLLKTDGLDPNTTRDSRTLKTVSTQQVFIDGYDHTIDFIHSLRRSPKVKEAESFNLLIK